METGDSKKVTQDFWLCFGTNSYPFELISEQGEIESGCNGIVQWRRKNALFFSFEFPPTNCVGHQIDIFDKKDQRRRMGTKMDTTRFCNLDETIPMGGVSYEYPIRIRVELGLSGDRTDKEQEVVTESTKALRNDLARLLESEDDADVELIVDGETLRAHRCVLRARSTYFAKMFDSGMSEDSSSRAEIGEVDVEAFKVILKFLYTGSVNLEGESHAPSVLPKADEMGLADLKRLCVDVMKDNLDTDNACLFLRLAHLHGCADLKADCLALIKQNGRSVSKTDGFENITQFPDIVREIFCCLFD